MRVLEVDFIAAEQLFHIGGVLGSPVRQRLPQHVEFEREEVVETRDSRDCRAKIPFLRSLPELLKRGVIHKHQVQTIAKSLRELCEVCGVRESLQSGQKYRLLLVHLAGRTSRFQCKLRLRFRASEEASQRVQRMWEVFELPTHATAFT